MTNIMIYDTDNADIEEICEENDTTPAEVIQALLDVVKDEKINIAEYL